MMFTLTRSLRVSTMRASHPGLGLALCALAVAFVLPGCRQLPRKLSLQLRELWHRRVGLYGWRNVRCTARAAGAQRQPQQDSQLM